MTNSSAISSGYNMMQSFSERYPSLVWASESGIGYYPVGETPYDSAYFDKYLSYEDTDSGRSITQSRVDYVQKHLKQEDSVLDVGIGSGHFMKTRGIETTWGADINPKGIEWLKKINRICDPTDPLLDETFEAITFWDSLEHIHDPSVILSKARNYVFVSAPIYRDLDHVLSSKHFRKDEHCWYWTMDGMIRFMEFYGFSYLEHSNFEQQFGREDIGTFVFTRVLHK